MTEAHDCSIVVLVYDEEDKITALYEDHRRIHLRDAV
jgi:hypothetical protein